jgi:hypothetical protein
MNSFSFGNRKNLTHIKLAFKTRIKPSINVFFLVVASFQSIRKIFFLDRKILDKLFMSCYNAIVVINQKEGAMRLYEFRDGVLHPYWQRNGRLAGVSLPIPVSELFIRHGIRKIGRGHLCSVLENGVTVLALLAQCDPDSGALVMVEAPEVKFNGGFLRLSSGGSRVVELLPGGSITTRGRQFIWDGRNLKRI